MILPSGPWDKGSNRVRRDVEVRAWDVSACERDGAAAESIRRESEMSSDARPVVVESLAVLERISDDQPPYFEGAMVSSKSRAAELME